ncbi:MAG: hypothetical protein JSR68_08360 [Proteobacteria bacterium]|nr:hypothetical protein [Pseudomonadota bacterium]
MNSAVLAPYCPACGAVLKTMPQRKTKCPHCGEAMYVRRTPDSADQQLMTQAQADANEARWQERNVERARTADATAFPLAMAGDRDAILQLMASALRCGDAEAHERWLLLLVEIDLAKLARQGIRTAQLTAGREQHRLCPACQSLDQSIISTQAGARAVIPIDCACVQKGLLTVSGWIKRADGTDYVDMARN